MPTLHIIVQAGGRGSRLRHHTWNKPKCLVSIQGKPILYHLFDKFPSAHFHIIGDYAYDQLEKYLAVSPPAGSYTLHRSNEKGTLAGIADSAKSIDPTQAVMLVWGDLIINKLPNWPDSDIPTVCVTDKIICRWTYNEGVLKEQTGSQGLPGLFYFPKAKQLTNIPRSGEFAEWIRDSVRHFNILPFDDLEEMGDFTTVESQNSRIGFSRFFNEVNITDTTVVKQAIDPNYADLIQREQQWYEDVRQLGFSRIPTVLSKDPYTLTRIQGQHAYQMFDLTPREKRAVLSDYIDTLMNLHSLSTATARPEDVIDVYITKTLKRVTSVATLIPNFDQPIITVNGIKCRNLFSQDHQYLFDLIQKELSPTAFTPIHGDPTFSNSLIDDNLRVWFIDPRGYFSKPGVWGDPLYDFAKVYYSAVGGYDTFNRRKFKLHIDSETVEILMEPAHFSDCAEKIFAEYFGNDLTRIKILHGLIWLGLSGYVKDDIDSIIGSFYLGLYYLEQGLKKL